MFFCFSKLSNCIWDRGLAGSDDGHGSDGSDDGSAGSDGSDYGSDGSDGRRISAMHSMQNKQANVGDGIKRGLKRGLSFSFKVN